MINTITINDVINEIILLIIILAVSIISGYVYRRIKNEAKKYRDLLQKNQKENYNLEKNQIKGDLYTLIGTFKAFENYDQILILSSTSNQKSIDLLGVRTELDEKKRLIDGSLDFIEIKPKHIDEMDNHYSGEGSEPNVRHIKQLVNEKKVKYIVTTVEIPEDINITHRTESLAKVDQELAKEKKDTKRNHPSVPKGM